jgi:hypothetical protein
MSNGLQRMNNGGAVATIDPELEDGIIIEDPMEMPQAIRAEVDMQITTARRYPRSIRNFRQQALEMATFDEETASGCFYSMPRSNKPIEGPSVRLAEIVLSAWGNVRSDAKIVGVDAKEITAEAMTWDLEKNVAVRVQVKRRITDRNGRRFNDDMITVTGNAACAIALRNSVFKVIPMVYTKAIYQAARQVAIGDIKTIAAKRVEMVDYFGKMGITPDRVFAAIGKGFIEEIGLDELATLKGMATAIKDGDLNVDEAFPPVNPDGPAGVSGLKSRLNPQPAAEAVSETTPATETEPAQVKTGLEDPKPVKSKAKAAESTDEDPDRDQLLQEVNELIGIKFEGDEDRIKAFLNDRIIDNYDVKQLKGIKAELAKA